MRSALIIAGLLAAPCAAIAADGSLDAAGSLVQMLLGLAVVIGLLYASLHVLKRLGAGGGNSAGLVKVRCATAVGPRERVVLVDVGDKVLVLGVAPGRITPLHTLDAADLPGTSTAPDAPPPAGKDFQSWLKQTLERRSR